MNFEISPDYWLNCMQCLKDRKTILFPNRRYIGIGVEIDDNSLIVRCFKHNVNIKLFKLADEEIDLIPKKCDECSDIFGDEKC